MATKSTRKNITLKNIRGKSKSPAAFIEGTYAEQLGNKYKMEQAPIDDDRNPKGICIETHRVAIDPKVTSLSPPLHTARVFGLPKSTKSLKQLKKLTSLERGSHKIIEKEEKKWGNIYKNIFDGDSGDVLLSLKDSQRTFDESRHYQTYQGTRTEYLPREEDLSLNSPLGIQNELGQPIKRKTGISRQYLSRLSDANQKPQTIDFQKLKLKIKQLQKTHMRDQNSINVQTLISKLHLTNKVGKFMDTGDPSHLFYCKNCPHCRLKDGEMYKIKTRFKRPLLEHNPETAFFDFFNFYDKIVSLEEFHSLMDKNQDLITSKGDMEMFNNVIQELLSGEIKLTELFDEHFIKQLRSCKLYEGQSLEADYNKYIEALRESDASRFKYPPSEENYKVSEEINKNYLRHYKKYIEEKGEERVKEKERLEEIKQKISKFRKAPSYSGSPREQTSGSPSSLVRGTRREANKKFQSHTPSLSKSSRPNSRWFQDPHSTHQITFDHPRSVFEKFYNYKLNTPSHQNLKRDEGEDISNCVLYIGIQELIRQLASNEKEKGYLLLELFKRYFEENEKRWFKIINNLQEEMLRLKHEQEYLLAKYFKDGKEMDNILHNNEVTIENLQEHKRIIRLVLGSYFNEESKRIIAESRATAIEKDIKKWIIDWDILKISPHLNERFGELNDAEIGLKISLHNEYKMATREELSLLKNAERFLRILPYKNNWELENEELSQQLHTFKRENQLLSKENQKIGELLRSLRTDQQFNKEDLKASKEALKYAYRQIEVRLYENKSSQTDLDMTDANFLANIKKHLFHKREKEVTTMKKLVAQINRRSSTDKLNIISENKIYGVMEGCYTKLLILFHESNRKLRDIRFDELFYEYMSAKYGIKSVIKQNSMHILSNILHYSRDEMVELFGNYLGIGTHKYGEMIINFYAALLISTGESMETIIIPNSTHYLNYLEAKAHLAEILCNAPSFIFDIIKKNLASNSSYYMHNEEQKLNSTEKLQILYLYELQAGINEKGTSFTQLFEKQGENMGGLRRVSISAFVDIIKTYLTLNIPLSEALSFAESCFANYQESEYVYLTDINKAYSKNYQMRVNVREYLSFGINGVIKFEQQANVCLKRMIVEGKLNMKERISREEFVQFIWQRLPNKPKWQIMAIYQNVIDINGTVIYEELLSEILRNPLLNHFIEVNV